MHALWLALALVAAEPPVPAVAPVPVVAPVARVPAPPVAPALVTPERASPRPSAPGLPAPVEPAGAAPAPSAPATPGAAVPAAPAQPPPPLSQAAVEKLGQGDRAFLVHDYRNALFAYQDAVYLAPRSAVARVKLGRAYLALRYAARAVEQAELALAADPASADARRLLDEAKNPVARPAPAAAARTQPPRSAPTAVAPAAAPIAAAAPPKPRVYRLTPESNAVAPAGGPPASPAPHAAREAAAPRSRLDPAAAEGPRTVAVGAATLDPAAPAQAAGLTAGQRYRAALAQLQAREFAKADETLTDAILIEPRLAVAHAARASARFGLRRYREAATDYRTALELDPGLGTPLYGLAECYRVLGDAGSAAEMYARYARSGASDVREDLREIASRRAQELR
jgi:tetratricopeptide (TPR) repeat protein